MTEDVIRTATMFLARDPAGVTTLLGCRGHLVESRETVAAIVCDVPTQVRAPRTKTQAEQGDVSAFFRTLLGDEAPFLVAPGPDPNLPPDTVVTVGERNWAVEAAQIHLPALSGMANNSSVSRWAAFNRTRDVLMARSSTLSSRLRQHAGYMVYVWFGTTDLSPRERFPPAAASAPEDLINLLAKTPSPPPAPAGAPLEAADGVVAWDEDQRVGVSWGNLPNAYDSPVVRALGFELALVYGMALTQSVMRAELRRVMEAHDAPSDLLVLSVNAALRSGLYFPSARVVADMLFEDPDPLEGWRPESVPRVALHDPAEPGRLRWLVGDWH